MSNSHCSHPAPQAWRDVLAPLPLAASHRTLSAAHRTVLSWRLLHFVLPSPLAVPAVG